ncbi:MAG: aldo/keto reductase [Pseudomonadota bacterium]
MEYRPLGRTGLKVSALSLGTMTFGEQNTEAEAFEQMDYALEHGINLFDNAELYPIPDRAQTQGDCEEIMGRWMADRGARDKILVATKVIGRSERGWFRNDGHEPRLKAADIEEAIDKSLKRLQTDRIDLYQVHWPDRLRSVFGSNPTVYSEPERAPDETPIEESLEALDRLVKAGKVLHIGVSNESCWGVMKWLAASDAGRGPRIASIQNAYSLVNRTFETNLAEACLREDVGLLAYSALGQGYLTGKYQNGATPPGSRKEVFKGMARYEGPGADEAIGSYVTLARESGLDPAQMALAFAMSQPFMASVILGATKMSQLKTVVGSADITLSPDVVEAINNIQRARANPCP